MPRKPAASASRRLVALASLAIIAGGAAFFYDQRGARDDPARQHETAPRAEMKPASDAMKTAPSPQTASATNDAASPPSPAPGAAGSTANDEPSTDPPQWMSLEDFRADFKRRIGSDYPDRAWGRCRNGVLERGAHWSPRLAGHDYVFHPTKGDEAFRSDATDMSSKGYAMQYDNVSQNCDGTNQDQTLWLKGG